MDIPFLLHHHYQWTILHMQNSHTPHYHGHRKRLKQQLMENPASLGDYELLEVLLFAAMPRRDVKPLAKKLLQEFKTLAGVCNASQENILAVEGVSESIYTQLVLTKEFMGRILQQNVAKQEVLSSWSALMTYLKAVMGHNKTEQFRILFLNTKNILIADELQPVGTVDQTMAYPREIIKRALFHEASAIILVHNHPSGDPTPSKADIMITNKIVEACSTINIKVHDHVIIAHSDYYSFKSNLLL